MAEYMLAEEKDLVLLPDELSYCDGAQVACGFGTVYESLEKTGISGNDAVLITGPGRIKGGSGQIELTDRTFTFEQSARGHVSLL